MAAVATVFNDSNRVQRKAAVAAANYIIKNHSDFAKSIRIHIEPEQISRIVEIISSKIPSVATFNFNAADLQKFGELTARFVWGRRGNGTLAAVVGPLLAIAARRSRL